MLGSAMQTPTLPATTIAYLNEGAGPGRAHEGLEAAAISYAGAGIDQATAEEDLLARAEDDGIGTREAESIIRRAYMPPRGRPRKGLPPRPENFHAGRKGKGHARSAVSQMRNKEIPESLPTPIEDGFAALLRAGFRAGEAIRMVPCNDPDGAIDDADGITMLYEQWTSMVDMADGQLAGLPGVGAFGTFVAVNPLRSRESVRKNSDIAALRHVLVDFEGLGAAEQWALVESSRMPITAVVSTGNGGIHAWVRVDARTKAAYDAAAVAIYDYFDGYPVDGRNRNPSRLARMAGLPAGAHAQELIALNIGIPTFAQWLRWQAKEPEIMSWDQVDAADITRPPLLVHGMLHRGSKMTIGGGSKSMKSWALADLAVSVATGQDWWGCKTEQGGVLVIDFELQRFFWRERVRSIITAKGGTIPHDLDVLPMRGRMADFEMVRRYVMEACDRRDYSMIILDPIYKCLGGRDENLAGDVASLMNEVESLTLDTGAAVVIAAHYSKGNQAAKDSLDRISGSGVFARDPDTIMAMTKHEDDGSFSVDVTVRNFEPVKSFVVSWNWPLMHRNVDLNPDDIKLPPNERAKQPKVTVAAFLKSLRGRNPMTKADMQQHCEELFGVKKSKFYEVFKEAEGTGKIKCICGLYSIREEN